MSQMSQILPKIEKVLLRGINSKKFAKIGQNMGHLGH